LPDFQIFVIGLVGGIASGKSHVARLFVEQGAIVIDADRLGHDVLEEKHIVRQLAQIFGPQVTDDNGYVRRSELAKLVFGQDAHSTAKRAQLEQIVHPEIHRAVLATLQDLRSKGPGSQVVLLDAPLLLEAGWAKLCDIILFVDTPPELRQRRALARGWTLQQFTAREAAQMPLDAKRQQATHVIDGAADDPTLRVAIRQLLDKIMTQ
jgi:dephospho-CoA kinase